tara:strand:+ start:2292 stop:3284 length:993 start_codon:yes stop_codon:yes gene_type:complete
MLQIAKVMTLTAQEITSKLTEQYKDVHVSIEFITPQQAQIYINRNFANNRKTVKNSIQELEREMKAGRFTLSDSAICFNTENILVNGQHRLLAVIKTGLTQPFIVIKNLPDKSKLIMDVGKSRVMSDRITISGIRITRKECSIIRHAMSKVGNTVGTEQFSRPCHDNIVAQTFVKHDQFLAYVGKLHCSKTRAMFIAAALKIYAEMIYNKRSGKRKLNHDMTPKERAIHFLNIVASGMASPINGVDKDIKPTDRAAQLLFNRTCDSSLKSTYWNSADAYAYTLRAAHHFMCGTDTTYIRQALEDPFKPFTELPSTNEIMEISSTQATNIT